MFLTRKKQNKILFSVFWLVLGCAVVMDIQAFFLWDDDQPPKRSREKCACAKEIREQVRTLTEELEQIRHDFQSANEKIQILEKSLNATERQAEELQQQNISLQEGRDMAHEDIDLMRAEMQRCTGDRAHLDDVNARYQTCQNQNYDLQQRLRDNETSFATISRVQDNCKAQLDWINHQLSTVLQENDKLRQSPRSNSKNLDDTHN